MATEAEQAKKLDSITDVHKEEELKDSSKPTMVSTCSHSRMGNVGTCMVSSLTILSLMFFFP